jgi:hypothetical protein
MMMTMMMPGTLQHHFKKSLTWRHAWRQASTRRFVLELSTCSQ